MLHSVSSKKMSSELPAQKASILNKLQQKLSAQTFPKDIQIEKKANQLVPKDRLNLRKGEYLNAASTPAGAVIGMVILAAIAQALGHGVSAANQIESAKLGKLNPAELNIENLIKSRN